jgi:hypothetical protein
MLQETNVYDVKTRFASFASLRLNGFLQQG